MGSKQQLCICCPEQQFHVGDNNGPGTETFTANNVNGNQSQQPIFANPLIGDLRQSFNSPTIDAGVDDPANGTLDLAAKPRTMGARTDIGAYEFQPMAEEPAPTYALSNMKLVPTKFRADRRGLTLRSPAVRPKTKRGQKPIGSLLTVTSSYPGELNLYAFKALKGRRSKTGVCGKPTRSNARGKRCTYYKRLSRFASAAVGFGESQHYFTGRWNGKKLTPGRYLLVAKHSGNGLSVPLPTAAEAGVVKRTVTIIR